MIEYGRYNANGFEFEVDEWEMKNQESAKMTPYAIRMKWDNLNEIARLMGYGEWEYYGQTNVIQRVGELISEEIPFYQKSLFIKSEIDDFGETWMMVVRNEFVES